MSRRTRSGTRPECVEERVRIAFRNASGTRYGTRLERVLDRVQNASWNAFFIRLLLSSTVLYMYIVFPVKYLLSWHVYFYICDLLPRTQASLCKKKQRCAYDEFTWSILVARDGRRVWKEECTWNARRLAVLGRFLATMYDFLQVFCYLFLLNWPMLIFFCHLGVNSCCYSWYIIMTYAIFKVLGY
jgi:hypothetical protein